MKAERSEPASRLCPWGVFLIGLCLGLGPLPAAAAEKQTETKVGSTTADEQDREQGQEKEKGLEKGKQDPGTKKKKPARKKSSVQGRRAARKPPPERPGPWPDSPGSQGTPETPGWGGSRSGNPEPPLVFTDQDLDRYRDPRPGVTSAPPAPAPPAPPAADPLKPFRDQSERSRWRQNKITLLQQKILELEEQLRRLETKRRSIQNPLLPRPTGPADPSDQGLSGPELLAKTDEEIRLTTEQLETTRMELSIFLQATLE